MSSYEGLSEDQQFACRVIADHARSTAFSIADGILPGNEGRNYVLRKIMRRAIYHGREHLGLTDPFFHKVCDLVVENFSGAYPELSVQRDFIAKMVRIEEERFAATVTVGLEKLGELSITADTPQNELFTQAARLYDTFGTPRDLIRVYLEEKGIEFDEDSYNAHFDAALAELQRNSGIGQTQRKSDVSPHYAAVRETVGANAFHGYESVRTEDAAVVAIMNADANIDTVSEGEQASIVLDNTPFYAESGGQVGDTGYLVGAAADGTVTRLAVHDTYSPVPGLIIHKVTAEKGSAKVGDKLTAIVDVDKRDATRRNHTATHLVHAALKEVLGTHVKQAGSVVAPAFLRFDFTHYQPLTAAEIAEVEDLVNRYILQNEPVATNLMALEEAMQSGAVAMFGEKYSSEVRVLSVGDGAFSRELCGGTHVRATGDIGSFKITADEAIASGVRRIRAVTGLEAFRRFRDDEDLIDRSLDALKTQRDQLPNAIRRLQDELKKTRREMDDLKLKIATGAAGGGEGSSDEAREVAGVQMIGRIVEGLDANGMRQLSDTLLSRLKSGVVVLGRRDEGKAGVIVRVSADLTGRVKAGNVIKEIVPILGGKGGGRPDMAEGGGPETGKLPDAIEAAYKAVETAMSGTTA